MMADALKMLLAMAIFFGAMYLYAWMPDILAARKEKRKKEKKELKIKKKSEARQKVKDTLQNIRNQKSQAINKRRTEIKEHLKWLKQMNQQINQQFDLNKED